MAQTLEHNKEVTTVVPVTIPAFDDDLNIIQKLDDEPNDVGGLTAAELKAKFDEGNLSAQQYINNVLIPTVVADDLSEQARQAAEAERVANEIERVANENQRSSAEAEREAAEAQRKEDFGSVLTRAEDYATSAAESANSAGASQTAAAESAASAAESASKAEQVIAGSIPENSIVPSKFSPESRSMMVRENLLDNWYFGNPVNQRGQTEYTGTVYGIDRWVGFGSWLVDGSGLRNTVAQDNLMQPIEQALKDSLHGRTVTVSALTADGQLHTGSVTYEKNPASNVYFSADNYIHIYAVAATGNLGIWTAASGVTIVAVKMELGAEQTLAHQENGVWVLNEIPDYNEQLLKCCMSTADSSDEYANNNKTAEAVAALPLDGGRLTGALELGNVNSGFNILQFIPWSDGTHIRNIVDSSNYSEIYIPNNAPDSSAIYSGYNNGSYFAYEFLHNGNAANFGYSRMVTGTYAGTGRNGNKYPNTLTPGFAPKAMIIWKLNAAEGEDCFAFFANGTNGVQFGSDSSGWAVGAMTATGWGSTSISWYRDISSSQTNLGYAQMNQSGTTYAYIIWG